MTSDRTPLLFAEPGTYSARDHLRLRLSDAPGKASLDGGWWPQSRDLDFELADLVDNLPAGVGHVDRVLYSRPDWDTQPDSVSVAQGLLKTGSFPDDDTNLIVLLTSTAHDLTLLVVPPGHPVGEQAMTIAATPTNRWSTTMILAVGQFDEDESESHEHWTNDGGSW